MGNFAPDVSVPGKAIRDEMVEHERARTSERERIAQQPIWEEYAFDTCRLEVPGGHLYRFGTGTALVFVER